MKRTLIITIVLIASLIIVGRMIVFFLFSKIEKEPEIITLQDPIQFVGLSIRTNNKNIYKDAAALGKEYTHFKETYRIPSLKEPWAFVAYSRDFDEETKSWEYRVGDVVTNLDSVPEGSNGYEIPAATYAIFTIRVKFEFLWGLEIARMKRHVFGNWLPRSKYKSTGCDFEYHDERSSGQNPSIDLYVAIEERNKGKK